MERFPVTFATGKHYQVDKSYIWLGSVVTTLITAFVVVLSGLDGIIQLYLAVRRGLSSIPFVLIVGLAILVFVIIFGLVVLIYYLSYKNMSFVFDERELSFYSGIIVKKRVHLPYERVQSVNHHASLIQRLVGVCTVVVDSAGGSSNKGVRIPYIRLQVAERLRSDLFVRKAAASAHASTELVDEASLGSLSFRMPSSIPSNTVDTALGPLGEWRGAFGGDVYTEEPVSFEFGLSNKQLLLASLTHPGPLIGGLVTAFCMIFGVVILLMFEEALVAFIALFSIPIIIGVAVAIWLVASVGILLGYGNFKVRRRGTRIEVERGLISRHFSGIDVSRIQSIDIKQSLIRNLMHYCEISLGRIDVQSKDANNKNSETKGLIIHPFLQVDQVEFILSGLLPEFDARPRKADCTSLPRVALRRSVLRRCIWYNWVLWLGLIAIVFLLAIKWGAEQYGAGSLQAMLYLDHVVGIFLVVFVACMIIATAVAAIGSVLWARHSAYCFKDQFLLVHNGGLYTATSLIPRQKIQSGNTRTNPFQRRLQLRTIIATTAAGYRRTDIRLMDVSQTDAIAYLEWLY